MEKKPLFEELPYREAIAVLRELDRNEDADFLEAQIDEIMKELGLKEEEVASMTFQEIGEVLSVYYINLQNQLIAQNPVDVPVSMSGQWMSGDVPPHIVKQMMRLQAQRMEEEKIKMGFY
jgi:hypothetical protein